MIVDVDVSGAAPSARLIEPDDFKGFKLVLRGAPEVGSRLAEVGIPRHEEHAWVPVETLRALAGDAATPAWEESLEGMLAFARSRGWVDDDGAVRAHVERAG